MACESSLTVVVRPVGLAAAAIAALACMTPAALAEGDCRASAAPGVDWNNCSKKLIIMSGSDLAGANLVGVDFSSTDLRDSNLLAADFQKATLIRASLADSKAKGANFGRIEGYRTDFSRIDGEGANFASAELHRSQFVDADLANVDFTKAELGRAQFDGATITGGKFSLANLARVDFRTAKFDAPVDFAGAFFFLVRVEGVDLTKTTGLSQWQLDMACGDDKTVLPQGLAPGASWPCNFEQE